jgi:hypothetical protein
MAINVPLTTTVTNHGLVISVGGGVVGAITSWAPSQTRTATPVFSFGDSSNGGPVGAGEDVPWDSGEPYEIVPGNIGGTTLRVGRYDIYTQRFESAFGTDDLTMLTRQSNSIRFIEYINGPDGARFTTIYYGAWFTNLGRSHDAKSDRIVMVNGDAMYARKRAA